jgi:hypothetical protein
VPPLQIDFEDGFEGDTVVVSAGGDELWRQEGLTTNPANVAAIAHVEVPEGAQVEVQVPTRRLNAAARVETRYLEVRIIEDRLKLQPSRDLPFHL